MRLILKLSLFCFFVFLTTSNAKADTIGPICASCNGASYTLTYKLTSNPNIVDVLLSVNTTQTSSADYLKAVSLKLVSQSSEITSISTLSEPTGFSTPTAGGTSAGALGCSGSGNGFFCAQTSSEGVETGHSSDIYNFAWALTLQSPGDLLTGTDAASIKAIYLTTKPHNKIGLGAQTSENITLTPLTSESVVTPEPTSLLLMASGLLGLALFIKVKPHIAGPAR